MVRWQLSFLYVDFWSGFVFLFPPSWDWEALPSQVQIDVFTSLMEFFSSPTKKSLVQVLRSKLFEQLLLFKIPFLPGTVGFSKKRWIVWSSPFLPPEGLGGIPLGWSKFKRDQRSHIELRGTLGTVAWEQLKPLGVGRFLGWMHLPWGCYLQLLSLQELIFVFWIVQGEPLISRHIWLYMIW